MIFILSYPRGFFSISPVNKNKCVEVRATFRNIRDGFCLHVLWLLDKDPCNPLKCLVQAIPGLDCNWFASHFTKWGLVFKQMALVLPRQDFVWFTAAAFLGKERSLFLSTKETQFPFFLCASRSILFLRYPACFL